MSIKIRCDECSKKILVDEGFAGGVCRCPYCKAIVMVPGDSDASVGIRPQAPASRPAAPGSRPQAPLGGVRAGTPGDVPATQSPPRYTAPTAVAGGSANFPASGHIPMAKPVKIQGIVTLILFGLIAAMLIGAVVVVAMVVGKHAKGGGSMVSGGGDGAAGQGGSEEQAPVVAISGPSVAGTIKITSPVVYVIDGGSGMADTYDAAFSLTRGSIKTLASDQKFSVIVAGESEDVKMGDLIGGGSAGATAAKKFLEMSAGHGASNLGRAIDAALAMKPSMIVIFCRKAIADDTAAKARAGGVKLVGIAMDAGGDVINSLTEAAKQTGGEVKALSQGDLANVGDASD